MYPVILTPTENPIVLKPKIKEQLDLMEQQQVMWKIEEPTEWVSSLTYVSKKDNTIRSDPKRLNQALIRSLHKAPTLEELNKKFSGSKYFYTLDAKAVTVDAGGHMLTTFQTQFGKYGFQLLPFELSVSKDIFQ